MLLVDLALIVFAAVVLVAGVAVVGGRLLGPRLEKRRRELQGRRNAELERARLDEKCASCGEGIDPAVDLFENGEWWHRRCWRDATQ